MITTLEGALVAGSDTSGGPVFCGFPIVVYRVLKAEAGETGIEESDAGNDIKPPRSGSARHERRGKAG